MSVRAIGAVVVTLVGVMAIVLVVREAGPDTVLAAAAAAGPWLPLLLTLELGIAMTDSLVTRRLHGVRAELAPTSDWLRGALLATVAAQALPGGRLVGEVLRAIELAPTLGRARAALAASVAHGYHVLAAAFTAGIGALTLAAIDTTIAGVLGAVATWTLGLAVGLILAPWSARFAWAAARRVMPSLDAEEVVGAAPSREGARAAIVWALAARALHVVQSGVALVAVTGSVDTRRTIALEGMQLVAANAGDLVPGHAGVLEVSARHFATVLTSGVLGTAIALALTLRLARILSAALAAMALSRGLRRMAALSVSSLLVVASTASAQVELVGRERLVGLVGPVGAEHMFAIAAREDWQRDDDLLSLGTGVETGLISYTSPIDSLTGGYVEVTPLSFLVLRAEVLGVGLWPIGMDGTGYHAVRGEVVDPSRLPSDEGRLAAGIDARVGATLQLAVQLGGLRPILFAQPRPSTSGSARATSTSARATTPCSRARTGW